jgi:hypothetical protein
MNDHDVLLVMTICQILGKDPYPDEVEREFKQAKQKLDTSREPPTPAQVYIPPRY